MIADHRESTGKFLPARVAAVELLNILRPTVAITHFITLTALALHDHPEWRTKLSAGEDQYLEPFVHEVRRWYPFFPVVAGRVRKDFEWNGVHFPRGRRVLLDLYGTDRDPRCWDDPEHFRPERFLGSEPTRYGFLPQGGGTHAQDHRCAGEWITIELMKTALKALTRWMGYEVPKQDLRVRLSRIPARPRSGFIITNIRQPP